MKNNLKMGISIGGPTIIMIFVVLCMTTLGTLSLVTANADLKLTQKTVDSTTAYYAADNKGEQFLSQLDSILKQDIAPLSQNGPASNPPGITANQASAVELIGKIPGTTAVKNSNGSLSITHIIKISDAQKLLIEISASSANLANPSRSASPSTSSIEASSAVSKRYTINTWKVVNNDYWRYENYETPYQDAIPQNE